MLDGLGTVHKQIIALIPARSGSKGLPGKNLLEINGRSLLERAIESSNSDQYSIETFVTSEDDFTLKTASNLGAKSHKRNTHASSDKATAASVVHDFLRSKIGNGLEEQSVIVYLQPTSPFRNSHHVNSALSLFFQGNGASCVSVRAVKDFPEKMVRINQKGFITSANSFSRQTTNRQELKRSYYPNGAIYIFTVGDFKILNDIPVIGSIPYEMDYLPSIDIDEYVDLLIARGVSQNEPF